jgi:hypothetical protein
MYMYVRRRGGASTDNDEIEEEGITLQVWKEKEKASPEECV